MIKYLGSKRLLLPTLLPLFEAAGRGASVIDLFSGTSRVGHALKRAEFQVFANDHTAYAATLARAYVAADAEDHLPAATALVAEFNRLPGAPGYVTKTFCERSRFFQPKNGARIDAIREAIEHKALDPELKAVMLVSLMEAADRVDSTVGLQMAYLKQWAARASNDLELRVPDLLPFAAGGKGEAHEMDALEAANTLSAEVAYLDPPYNQHKYLGNYHIWESLVRWDKPEVYGIACKRIDCRTRASDFNAKPKAKAALQAVIRAVQARHVIVSFSDEGYLTRHDLETMLAERGPVFVLERDHARHVGAKIGIYDLKGKKVGKPGALRNTERIYLTSRDPLFQARIRAIGAVPAVSS